MGTNFYVRPEGACATRCDNWVHLGKSSIGWAFTFRAYPDGGAEFSMAPAAVTWPVTDFASWRKLLDLGEIHDEYGKPITAADLLEWVENRRDGRKTLEGRDYYDADGNMFCSAEFS